VSATKSAVSPSVRAFDVEAIRREFPGLDQQVHGKPLVYLDNAATAQKPRAVLEATTRAYERDCANVHRGVHTLAERATRDYEAARGKVARWLGVSDAREVVFVRGATEGLNLLAWSFGRPRLGPGDEVLITELEHHSNIVPWQLVAQAAGATVKAVPVNPQGELDQAAFERLLGPRTKLLAFTHTSNALGTTNPVARMCALARERGVPTIVDGCQAVPHGPVDVAALGCDFFVFSGHKLFGPTATGGVWGRKALLDAMPPWQGGGDMIATVSLEKGSTWAPVPAKFEAGTPNIAGFIGLAAGLDWLSTLDWPAVRAHEQELLAHATRELAAIPGLRIVGQAKEKASVVSFVMDGCHPHDVATIVDHERVAVRAGHHCAQPLMACMKVPATTRASFAFYNTHAEVERLAVALHKVRELLL